VFSPALDCNRTKPLPESSKKKLVSKVFHDQEDALHELDEHKFITKIDDANVFTLKRYKQCRVKKSAIPEKELERCNRHSRERFSHENMFNQIIYDNGGMNLDDASYKYHFESIVNAMTPLFKGLVIMADNEYTHNDIKPLNIVYSAEKKKSAYIDFGLGISFKKVFTIQNVNRNSTYIYYPAEYALYNIFMRAKVKTLHQLYRSFDITNDSPIEDLEYAEQIISTRVLSGYCGFTKYMRLNDKFARELSRYGLDMTPFLWHKHPMWNAINVFRHIYESCEISDITDEDQLLPARYKANVTHHFNKYVDKVDVYMLGISLLEVFIQMYGEYSVRLDTREDRFGVSEYLSLCSNMVNTNMINRYTPRQALAHFAKVKSIITNSAKKIDSLLPTPIENPLSAANNSIFSKIHKVPVIPKVKASALKTPDHIICPKGKQYNPLTKRCRKIALL
jgi:serine/threonine protein kinase